VPEDVSVVGFDDSTLIAFTDPPLTTVRKPVPAMGQAAVRTLLEEIAGTPAPHSEFVFMPELVVRGSTASAPPPPPVGGTGGGGYPVRTETP
jgi:DNA-binding LacI/PurR family transcriptional regulator